MKRLLKKYTSLLLVLPLLFAVAGCDINPLALGGSEEDLNVALEDNSTDKSSDIPAPPSVTSDTDAQPGAEADDKDSNADKKNKKANEKEDEELIALSGKSAILDIDSEGRTTPFVPYRERNLSYSSLNFGDLPLPPMSGDMDESLNDLISAKVTGILYDPNSPSAIINVLDDDYLVKPGDEIEGFKISSITKDYVAIQTGSNVYRAKVGDIVDGEVYGSGTYNIGYKFAGRKHPARKEDVLIFATKKQNENTKKGEVGFNDMSLPPVPEIKTGLPKINLKTQAGEIPLPVNDTN